MDATHWLAGFGCCEREGLRANCVAVAKLAVRRDYRLLACDNTIKVEINPPNTNKLTILGEQVLEALMVEVS